MRTIHTNKEIKIGCLYKSQRLGAIFEEALYLGCITPQWERFLVVVQAPTINSIGQMVRNENNSMWGDGFLELEHVGD